MENQKTTFWSNWAWPWSRQFWCYSLIQTFGSASPWLPNGKSRKQNKILPFHSNSVQHSHKSPKLTIINLPLSDQWQSSLWKNCAHHSTKYYKFPKIGLNLMTLDDSFEIVLQTDLQHLTVAIYLDNFQHNTPCTSSRFLLSVRYARSTSPLIMMVWQEFLASWILMQIYDSYCKLYLPKW